MQKKNGNKLLAALLILTITFFSISIEKVFALGTSPVLSVIVQDINTDSKIENATIYIVKHPLDKNSINIISQSSTTIGKVSSFALNAGKYSIGAFHPDFGYAVKVINITDDSTYVPIMLKLKPVAENWTDLNGTTYSKLTSWPFMTPDRINPTVEESSEGGMQPLGFPILLDEQYFYMYSTKVGEVYSTEGLTVNLSLKFASSIQTKTSMNGGPLTVVGTTQRSSTTAVSMPSVSNGASRSIYNYYDYKYQLFWWQPGMEEIWSEAGIYPGSAVYSTPYPTPSFKSLSQVNDLIDATDTSPYDTKVVVKQYNRYQGASWSIGTAIALQGSWHYYIGTIGLGGTFSFTSYTQNEAVYTLNLQGGRFVYIYEWNNPGSGAAGTVLTYQNKYWVSSISAFGCLSGQGNAWDANNLIGRSNDGNYAAIYAGNYGDAGYIRAIMNSDASGQIYVYGYSISGYYNSHLYTYVSNNGYDWYLAGNTYVNYQSGLYYINAGYYSSTFRYITFVGYNDNYFSINLRFDSVHVVK